ncbi:hypothetical protein AB6A40_009240 [Gnathostoma spinigerum]|uniref:Hikeshi-like domain-containing protein n=1 Tax=Gnathostoma spinigerum TaxID=75299 RepID=A0ABD6ET87_9BILA
MDTSFSTMAASSPAQNIFGVIVAGRLLQANFVQASETEFVTEVPDANTINHVVVFLTGVQPFPEGLGGSVFVGWPQDSGVMNWYYLGFICNSKPSAIFRVAQLHKLDTFDESVFSSMAMPTGGHSSAQIGISVEQLSVISSRVPAGGTTPSQQAALVEFSQKMLENFVNYAQSFVVRLPQPQNLGCIQEYIPASVIQSWYNNFKSRLQQNPNFWRNLS